MKNLLFLQENEFSGTTSMFPSTMQSLCTHVNKLVTSDFQICFPAPYLIARQLRCLFTFDIVVTVLGKFEVDLPRQSWLWRKLPLFNQLVVATVWGSRGGKGWGHSSELQTKSQVSAVPGWGVGGGVGVGGGWGWGGGGGGCGYVVVVIGPLAKVSLMYVVSSVIQLQVKSLWHRIKVAMRLKKCCRVVPSFAAEFADCVAELSFC